MFGIAIIHDDGKCTDADTSSLNRLSQTHLPNPSLKQIADVGEIARKFQLGYSFAELMQGGDWLLTDCVLYTLKLLYHTCEAREG